MIDRARLLRLGRIAFIVTGLLVALVLLAVAFVVATVPGANFVVQAGIGASPAKVRVGAIEGTLWSPLVLREVTVDHPAAAVRIDVVRLRWRPLALLGRTVHVDSLLVGGIEVTVRPEGFPKADSTAEKALPFERPAGTFRVDSFRLQGGRVAWAGYGTVDSIDVTAAGDLDSFTVALGLRAGGPQVPPASLTAHGGGSFEHFDLAEAVLATLGGTVRTDGTVRWAPDLAWRAHVTGSGLEPGRLAPKPEEWPGTLSFRARSDARLVDGVPIGHAALDTLDGVLRGKALTGSAHAELSRIDIGLARARFGWGGAFLDASGRMGDSLSLDLVLEVPDLGEPLPRAAGRVLADAQVRGAVRTPRATGTWSVEGVALDSLALDRSEGTFDVDLRVRTARLDAHAAGLAYGVQAVDSLTVTLAADADALELAARANAPVWSVATSLRGDGLAKLETLPKGGAWHGEIAALDVTSEWTGAWSLVAPAPLAAAADSASLGDLVLRSNAAEIGASGSWRKAGSVQARAHGDAIPLALAPASLPEGMTVDGALSFAADLTLAPDSTFAGFAEATLTDTRVVITPPDARDRAWVLRITGAQARLDADDAGLRTEFAGAVTDSAGRPLADAAVTFALPGYRTLRPPAPAQRIEARLTGGADDLSFVDPIVLEADSIAGRAKLDATVGGTLERPEIAGGLDVDGLTAAIGALGITIRDGRLALTHDAARGIVVDGGARSGGGDVKITGTSPIPPTAERPGRIRIDGERFQVADLPEARLVASPHLSISFSDRLVDVRGEVTIPETRIELVEIPEVAIAPSPDVVFVEPAARSAPPPVDVAADVRVVLGDGVFFRGFGFTSFFEGDLRVTKTPDAAPQGSGELRFREGRFRAYGQDLTIDQGLTGRQAGRLLFNGPIDNPGVLLKAYRTAVDGTEAGLDVSGFLKTPVIKVYSDPALPQADALSYILLGRPLDQGSEAEKASVASTAAMMGSNVLATRLASKVGIDEAGFEGGESGTLQDASLVIGKYLSPTLYASYGMSLFDRASKFRLRYMFSPALSVQTESGTATGADFLYRLQFGKPKPRERASLAAPPDSTDRSTP